MLGLYDAVGSGIVARNPDVTDTIAGCQDVECGNIGRGIVGDEFFETTPATEDVLEDEVCDDFSRVRGGSATFGIGGESVASVVDVAIGAKLRHKKGINVSLAKHVEQVVYSIYHMVLYFLLEGDGWLRLLVSGSRRERAIGLSHLEVHLYILVDRVTVTAV